MTTRRPRLLLAMPTIGTAVVVEAAAVAAVVDAVAESKIASAASAGAAVTGPVVQELE